MAEDVVHEPPFGSDFYWMLSSIIKELHEAEYFDDIRVSIEKKLLLMFSADRVTVYIRSSDNRPLVSTYIEKGQRHEVSMPLSTSSIAGYVGLSQKPLWIHDVYDAEELTAIHPDLCFDRSFDNKSGFRTGAEIAVPIVSKKVLLGVMQLIHARHGDFSEQDLAMAETVAELIAQKIRYQLQGTRSPFSQLLDSGVMAKEDFEHYQRKAKRKKVPLTRVLLHSGKVTPSDIGRSFERYYHVPYVGYRPGVQIRLDLISDVSLAYLRQHSWLPVSLGSHQQDRVILIDDPADVERIMMIQKLLGWHEYSFRLAMPEDINHYLDDMLALRDEHNIDALLSQMHDESVELVADQRYEAERDQDLDKNAPAVIKLVSQIIRDASELGSSDIHIEPGKRQNNEATAVRYRIDGICQRMLEIPATHSAAVIARIKVLCGMDTAEHRLPQDGRCIVRVRKKKTELRVASVPTIYGEDMVLRLLSSRAFALDEMGFSDENRQRICRMVEHPHGIFLVVGPTGSGKTTALHAILNHINTPERKIWTVEDPVEITQAGLRQIQVNRKAGLDFARALRALLRADPDVMMVGEIRDLETANMSIEASLTGHLVFSTLHTNSAAETVLRLVDMGIDPLNFSDALIGVLAQRLVPTLCPHCKRPYHMDKEEREVFIKHYHPDDAASLDTHNLTIFAAQGCKKCNGTGYAGRTAIHELLVMDPELKAMVIDGATAVEISRYACTKGMRTLLQDFYRRALQGTVSPKFVHQVV